MASDGEHPGLPRTIQRRLRVLSSHFPLPRTSDSSIVSRVDARFWRPSWPSWTPQDATWRGGILQDPWARQVFPVRVTLLGRGAAQERQHPSSGGIQGRLKNTLLNRSSGGIQEEETQLKTGGMQGRLKKTLLNPQGPDQDEQHSSSHPVGVLKPPHEPITEKHVSLHAMEKGPAGHGLLLRACQDASSVGSEGGLNRERKTGKQPKSGELSMQGAAQWKERTMGHRGGSCHTGAGDVLEAECVSHVSDCSRSEKAKPESISLTTVHGSTAGSEGALGVPGRPTDKALSVSARSAPEKPTAHGSTVRESTEEAPQKQTEEAPWSAHSRMPPGIADHFARDDSTIPSARAARWAARAEFDEPLAGQTLHPRRDTRLLFSCPAQTNHQAGTTLALGVPAAYQRGFKEPPALGALHPRRDSRLLFSCPAQASREATFLPASRAPGVGGVSFLSASAHGIPEPWPLGTLMDNRLLFARTAAEPTTSAGTPRVSLDAPSCTARSDGRLLFSRAADRQGPVSNGVPVAAALSAGAGDAPPCGAAYRKERQLAGPPVAGTLGERTTSSAQKASSSLPSEESSETPQDQSKSESPRNPALHPHYTVVDTGAAKTSSEVPRRRTNHESPKTPTPGPLFTMVAGSTPDPPGYPGTPGPPGYPGAPGPLSTNQSPKTPTPDPLFTMLDTDAAKVVVVPLPPSSASLAKVEIAQEGVVRLLLPLEPSSPAHALEWNLSNAGVELQSASAEFRSGAVWIHFPKSQPFKQKL